MAAILVAKSLGINEEHVFACFQHPAVPCPSVNGEFIIPLIWLIEQIHVEEVPLLPLLPFLPAELGVQGQHEITIWAIYGWGSPWGSQPKNQAQKPRAQKPAEKIIRAQQKAITKHQQEKTCNIPSRSRCVSYADVYIYM